VWSTSDCLNATFTRCLLLCEILTMHSHLVDHFRTAWKLAFEHLNRQYGLTMQILVSICLHFLQTVISELKVDYSGSGIRHTTVGTGEKLWKRHGIRNMVRAIWSVETLVIEWSIWSIWILILRWQGTWCSIIQHATRLWNELSWANRLSWKLVDLTDRFQGLHTTRLNGTFKFQSKSWCL